MRNALLVGINKYGNSSLRSCVKDTLDIHDTLTQRFGLDDFDITVLNNEEATKKQILTCLSSYVRVMSAGDVLMFYFSGHGLVFGKNEALVPYDFLNNGCKHDVGKLILDKELHEIFLKIPKGCYVIFIADCCHSGDMQKEYLLPKMLVIPALEEQRALLKELMTDDAAYTESVSDTNVVLLSACRSNQVAQEDPMLDNGVFTFFIIEALTEYELPHVPTFKELLKLTSNQIKTRQYTQNPSISGNKKLFDLGFFHRIKQ